MKNKLLISAFVLLVGIVTQMPAQKLSFNGQVSALHLSKIAKPWQSVTAVRYVPELKFEIPAGKNWKFDAEASANAYGQVALQMPDSLSGDVNLKPYRIWGRIGSERFELRLGLQKISFGSAVMLRPLMWFDHMDPRDPLQLTDGVNAALARYFFQNNSNLWLWGILPGKTAKGWELMITDHRTPEFGGRLQLPAGKGELGLSGHFRYLDKDQSGSVIPINLESPVTEYHAGLDGKWDIGPGIWFEATHTYANLLETRLKHVRMLTLGTDYTFGLGNGLTLMAEQFFYQTGPSLFKSSSNLTFTATSVTYPLNLAHSLSAMVFYNWTARNWYRFVNWRISLSSISLYIMAFWNPESFDLYQNTGNSNLMGGKGLQFMFVWNH